ncbi:MAG: Serine--tRNA ligase [Candidatus Ordinivivax streblomastigis]|uniref:Serine--tRNA ligase n=1 Tax=Candidatus Ordinivivax streblomastigis TaxID=2540710 RepID=A0A5M8NYA3_9BACT|nr:MAG: Serine--tRNA ligase [Candidatus Ordinivivax streblomastigis]
MFSKSFVQPPKPYPIFPDNRYSSNIEIKMLTLKIITENPQEVIHQLAKKQYDAGAIIAEVIETDKKRKSTQVVLDGNLAQLNTLSKSIGQLMKEGQKTSAEQARQEVAALKEGNKQLETDLKEAENKLTALLLQIPNLPSDRVPEGKRAEDNVVEKTGGRIPDLYEGALPHWELAKKYDLIDFELGVKIAGAGFPVYKQQGARLQRALINFFLDKAREAGYIEIQPPYVVNEDSGYGTGQLPDKEGQMYHCTADNLYLIPTAEVPVTNIYRDVILDEKELPIKNTAYSACFRREAGSYGKDVRGLNRLHQFDKVEIVRIEKPEHSYESLQEMVDYVQSLVEQLELPWRILRLCGGDMSFTSALTFDFEVFSAAQKRWLEVSSVSNFENYQANRLKCRYRGEDKKTQLCHTLNGSALALPRIVAALLENNQTPEGIRIPKALVPYTGFDMIS